jgi:hypothetical protein
VPMLPTVTARRVRNGGAGGWVSSEPWLPTVTEVELLAREGCGTKARNGRRSRPFRARGAERGGSRSGAEPLLATVAKFRPLRTRGAERGRDGVVVCRFPIVTREGCGTGGGTGAAPDRYRARDAGRGGEPVDLWAVTARGVRNGVEPV